jgi:GH24 family phage-related lysozyme (muramidase)
MNIRELIKKHEGVRLWAYTDSLGIWTFACGFNLERAGAREALAKAGLSYDLIWAVIRETKAWSSNATRTKTELITMAQVDQLLDADIAESFADVRKILPSFDTMPENAKAVLVDLHFNMGGPTLRTFKNTLAAFRAGDWKAAAAGLRKSKWATQVGKRADENIGLLEAIK